MPYTPNVIYLLSCNQCNVQYAGKTTSPLHKRINLNRGATSGCEYVIKYFKDVCNGASVQIIGVFPGNRETRLDREDYWIQTLRTSYTNGLNERKRKASQIYQLDVHFSLFQGQDKDQPDVEITPILITLKTWNPYVTVFITTLLIILKMISIIYKYV